MIGALKGIPYTTSPNPILFFVGPIGYTVFIGEKTRASLSPTLEKTLFIHTHVRDDALELYGFTSPDELTVFEHLLTVSGIGPKTAQHVIDRGVDQIRSAVATSDVEFFTMIPRLGKKNAQKIIIELKNKLGSTRDLSLSESGSTDTKELLDALTSMGFGKSEAMAAIRNIDPEITSVKQKIRRALQILDTA